jgi:hypothetical protein
VGLQHIHIIMDCRAIKFDVLVCKEIDEHLWNFIDMPNMKHESVLRDGELQDGGALVTLSRVGELEVQAHGLQTQKKCHWNFGCFMHDISKF